MDNQAVQPTQLTDQINLSPKPNGLTFGTVFIFVGILLGFIIGFAVRPIISPQKNTQTLVQKPQIDESKLPISLSLLTNPLVTGWSGSVTGKIIKRDEHSFTLTDGRGNNITITDIPPAGTRWKTVFIDRSRKREESSYSALPVGSTLRGNFYILKDGPNRPVGGVFDIL